MPKEPTNIHDHRIKNSKKQVGPEDLAIFTEVNDSIREIIEAGMVCMYKNQTDANYEVNQLGAIAFATKEIADRAAFEMNQQFKKKNTQFVAVPRVMMLHDYTGNKSVIIVPRKP